MIDLGAVAIFAPSSLGLAVGVLLMNHSISRPEEYQNGHHPEDEVCAEADQIKQ